MADEDNRDPNWGDSLAKSTFFWTMILAVLYVGSVFVFIMRY